MTRKARSLADSLLRARAPGAKPARVSLIVDGVKRKAGCAPVRVCGFRYAHSNLWPSPSASSVLHFQAAVPSVARLPPAHWSARPVWQL